MLKHQLLLFGTAVATLLIFGCEDPGPVTPPVMNAMNGIREVQEADAAAKSRVAVAKAAAKAKEPGDILLEGVYTVEFETTAGPFTIEVHRDWAPIGAERFYQLVDDGFYNEAGFFRVVKGFMVQFGMAADPRMTYKWDRNIQDDPVTQSNKRGYVTFAKTAEPNSRSTQVFINFGDNSRLDGQQFAPFGIVTKGMANVNGISSAHGEDPDQSQLKMRGNVYLKSKFPKLDYIKSATIVKDAKSAADEHAAAEQVAKEPAKEPATDQPAADEPAGDEDAVKEK